MKIKNCISTFILFVTITVSIVVITGSAVAAGPVRVAILPFDIHADKDLDFLKSGIQDMLSARLSWKDKVEVIDKTAVNQTVRNLAQYKGESLALLAGGQLKADYILIGSLTVIGQGAGIDARVLDITGKVQAVPFFGQTQTLGGVIPEINRLATEINERVFQRRMASGNAETMQPLSRNAAPKNNASKPNPMLQNTATATGGTAPINSNFQTRNSQSLNTGFWKSRPLSVKIIGMDVGDVNDDGVLETVVLTEKAIIIFQITGDRMVKLTEIPFSRLSHPLGLDIGDINKNGTPEIFISSLTPDRDRANSYVLEFNAGSYPVISKKASCYYRISKKISGDMVLLGQEQRRRDADIYAAPVYEMQWKNNEYTPSRKLLKAKSTNILGVAAASNSAESGFTMAAFDTAEHLTIYTKTGIKVWRSPEPMGGTLSTFVLPKDHVDDDVQLQFFPLRIRIHDMDHNKIPEIITATNHNDSIGMLSNFRSYDRSVLESRSLQNAGMILNWKTNALPGRITDFTITDFDNDGKDELVAATVTQEGTSALSEAKSRLVAYDLTVPAAR